MDKKKIFAIVFVVAILLCIGTYFLVSYLTEGDSHSGRLEFLPKSDSGSDLIWITRWKDNQSFFGDQLIKYMEEHLHFPSVDDLLWASPSQGSGKVCTYANHETAIADEYCTIDPGQIQFPNYLQTKFGYTTGQGSPVILLYLKNVDGWKPEHYTSKDAEKLDMPSQILDQIKAAELSTDPHMQRLNTIWISCDGTNPVDKENIGPVRFYAPGVFGNFPGIPGYYFPYLNQLGYQTPFILAQFRNPGKNVIISVECRAWAKNLDANTKDSSRGYDSVSLEILID